MSVCLPVNLYVVYVSLSVFLYVCLSIRVASRLSVSVITFIFYAFILFYLKIILESLFLILKSLSVFLN